MILFNPTQQQKKALDASGAVLVSAAAGSGKTAVLSNRVVKKVIDSENPVDITDLLIVTFTNSAAEEMRERISSLLSAAVAANPDNYRIMRQKLSVDSAHIGTIDSFCIDLVRDNFAQAGVNPDFKIISNDRLQVMLEQQVREAYFDLCVDDYDGYTRLLTALNCETADSTAFEAVLKIYKYVRTLPMPERWLDEAESMYKEFSSLSETSWFDLIISHAFDVADYHLSAINSVNDLLYCDEGIVKGYEPAYLYIKSVLEQIRLSAINRDYDSLFNILSDYIKPSLRATKCENKDARKIVKAAVVNARDDISELVGKIKVPLTQAEQDVFDAADIVSTLIRLVRIFWNRMQDAFNESGMLDFAGTELAALRLLCEDVDGKLCIKESSKELCNRFAEVMVDEYQDTNDLQNAIFNALSGNGERLFLVGDVKQCIYRFRHANPFNFINLRDSIPNFDGVAYPSKIDLSGNFRSRPEICDFVNVCFSLLMSKKSCSIDYLEGDRLDAKGLFSDIDDDCVEVHFVDTTEISVQAEHVAKYIKSCVEKKMPVSDKNGLRPAKYSDFMVLLRAYTKYSPYFVSAMKKVGVPVAATNNSDFFAKPEIMMIVSLLQAIDNPLKDIPLLSIMMSPIFGFTADETAQMRMCNRKGSLYSALLLYAQNDKKAYDFLQKINKYRSWSDSMSVDRLICRIYDDIGLTAIVRAMNDGAVRRANLLAFAEFSAEYERVGMNGLGAFLRHVDNVKKQGIEISGSTVESSSDTVRLMSIHGSKGLQAPVCIVAGLENSFNNRDSVSGLLLHEQYGIGMRVCDHERTVRYDTLPRIAISMVEHEAMVSEEMRLLYVAMTRAQDKLVLVAGDNKLDEHLSNAAISAMSGWKSVDDPIDSYAIKSVSKMYDWLLICLMLHPNAAELRNRAGIELNPIDAKYGLKIVYAASESMSDAPEENNDIIKEIDCSPMLDYRYPYEDLLMVQSKYSVSELSNSAFSDSVFKAKPAFITGETMTAAEKGTATHRFMCYADFSNAELSVENEALMLVNSGKLTVEQANGIDIDAIKGFFADDIYRRLCVCNRVMRESRFIFEVPAKEIVPESHSDESVIVQGVADCVIFESDGIVIVDFKTDRNTTEQALIERYTKQLSLYAKAFSSNYKMPVKQCLLYSFSLRKTVDLPM